MPTINRYVDISTVDREAKKDYIDRYLKEYENIRMDIPP